MRRPGLLAGLLLLTLVLPLIFMGALFALAGDQPSPSAKALDVIPPELLPIYQAAARTCEGLDWTILAAIHRIESGFGTRSVDDSSKGARGPMQFMPATFRSYGVDGDGDGMARIDDPEDAIFSAANVLCANGAGDPTQLDAAIWNYNHSDAYVANVIALANSFAVITFASAGTVSPADFLANPRIDLTPMAEEDVAAGIVDVRLLSLLDALSTEHRLYITVFKTGHSVRTRNGSISNHYYGRAADIFSVDDLAVSSSNVAARQLVLTIGAIGDPLRPDEVGHPFTSIDFGGEFTDADHQDHVHIGFD